MRPGAFGRAAARAFGSAPGGQLRPGEAALRRVLGGASRSRLARVATLATLALTGALAGCVEPDPDPYLDDTTRPIPGVENLAIDRGGRVLLDPGQGIAVAVEYAEGGVWEVSTACDTLASDFLCDFDIFVSTEDAPIDAFEGVDLEADDELSAPDDFGVNALLGTAEDTDGFTFSTAPGATVRVSALLYDPFDYWFDWSDDPRFISWVGHGAVHQGAPTNPVDLTPDRP